MVFINLSNHPSGLWNGRQHAAALTYGDIVDLPFPEVPADFNEEQIAALADQYVEQVLEQRPAAVLCQGEFTLAFAIVERLLLAGISVLSACSERRAVECVKDDGTTERRSVFNFVRFREYSLAGRDFKKEK